MHHKFHNRRIEMSTSHNTIYGQVIAYDIHGNRGYHIDKESLATSFLLTFSLEHTDETGKAGKKSKKSLPDLCITYRLSAPSDMEQQPFVLNAAKVLLDSYFNGRVVSFQPSLTQSLPYVEASTVQ